MPDGFFVTMEKSERESICRDAVLAVLENNWESFASKLNDDMDCSAQSKMEMVAPVLASMCALTSSSPATWTDIWPAIQHLENLTTRKRDALDKESPPTVLLDLPRFWTEDSTAHDDDDDEEES
ncbi:hypothetical protein AXG93_3943s1370 [Marchantia polymorpha subsp. ruderalis]|uniref:Uncharacterized protein n=1 Tax=Marchantia polymorpha subsp. ruderalis TaxID=1480154 RepID=A0A176WFJ7_MARPO|nr:hypothetical protein AXG93_3943s1370 [Marchantia polymorpha subsp. ruderalis]